MEGHPIPQDVTGFQFRLIGDMTVKQFGYLAVGLVLAWIFFSIPVTYFIRIPLAGFFGLTGVIFAFVPIQGMPADTMLGLFVKALIRPNQYVYDKIDTQLSEVHTVQIQQAAPAGTVPSANTTPTVLPQTPAPLTIPQQTAPQPQPVMPTTPLVTITLDKSSVPEPILPAVQQTLPPLPQQPITAQPKTPSAEVVFQQPTPPPVTPPVSDILQQPMVPSALPTLPPLQNLQTISPTQEQVSSSESSPATPQKNEDQSFIKTIPNVPQKPVATAPFMPDVPNLIAGVIKDSRENVLPNILIEVKDKDTNPVRAFKTNALGQFASATPLVNGTYTITFEDPKKQHRFDIIELSVTGVILPPFEIVSIDEREELRKSLFQN
jgi:PrgI family protein